MDDVVEVTVCDICGDAGRQRDNFLAICCKCPNGAEHTYCMRVMLKTLPEGDWMCEECKMRSDFQESGSPVNLNSLERKTEGVSISSTSHLSAERNGVSSEAQPVKKEKERVIRTSGESSRSSKPSNRALRSMDPPFKKLGKEKVEASIPVCSLKQSSYGSQGTPKLPARLGEESQQLDSQTEIAPQWDPLKLLSRKIAHVKFKGQLAEGGCLQKHNFERNQAFHGIGKGKNIGLVSKSESFNSAEKSNTICSEVILANASFPPDFKNLNSTEAKTAKGNCVSELGNPATRALATEAGVTAGKSNDKTVSCDETLFSGSNCFRLDAVQSCGQLDCILQSSAHKGPCCPNEEKGNKSWQAERSTQASSDCITTIARVKNFIIPRPDYIWLGKFQINISESIELICDGIQAHLSTHASQKASEVVDKLPDVIVVEELPRLMWPAQFVESGPTEENIALYFFAKDLYSYGAYYKGLIERMTKKDLALRGNLNGFELLIFPSNILPEKSQLWNNLLFLWGIFKGHKISNSANTPLSESQKRENRDTVRIWEFDLNAYPEDEDDMAKVHEIGELGSSRDRIFPNGASYNSGRSDSVKPLDVQERISEPVPDSDLSLRPESAIGNVSDKSNKDVKGKTPKQENDDAEDVELLHWKAAETLFLLSNGLTKISL